MTLREIELATSRATGECPPSRIMTRLVCVVMCGFIASGLGQATFAEDNVWTVRKLNDTKPWDRLADSPLSIRVEGRLGSSGSGQFRLLRCDAKFIVDSAKLKLIPPKSTVEIKGRFKKDGVKADFVVEDLKVVPNYIDQFESKASKLRRSTPDEWIELGDWATERANFYEDADLQKKANEGYSQAIEAEYRTLRLSDAEGRFTLAKKIDSYKLSKRRRNELIHEGLRINWQALQKAEPLEIAKWEKFAANLQEQLVGTKEPLKMVPPDLKETYEQDPVSTYTKASDESRIQLHRLFFVAVTRKCLLFNASSDGRGGNAIANQIDQRIPEEHALAETQSLLWLSYRVANITNSTRAEVENLAAAFRERQREDEGKQAVTRWIKAHELRLKGDGVIGRLQLADEYLSLLNDESAAVENLIEANTIDPGFEEAKSRLDALGYQWRKSRWVKADSTRREDENGVSQLPTGIYVGLPASGLRTLLGQPRSLARMISARGITEVWSFGPAGSTPLIVRLEQKGRETEPKVTAFSGQ